MDGHQKVYTLRQNFKRLWVNLTLPGSPSDGESTRYEVLTQALFPKLSSNLTNPHYHLMKLNPILALMLALRNREVK